MIIDFAEAAAKRKASVETQQTLARQQLLAFLEQHKLEVSLGKSALLENIAEAAVFMVDTGASTYEVSRADALLTLDQCALTADACCVTTRALCQMMGVEAQWNVAATIACVTTLMFRVGARNANVMATERVNVYLGNASFRNPNLAAGLGTQAVAAIKSGDVMDLVLVAETVSQDLNKAA